MKKNSKYIFLVALFFAQESFASFAAGVEAGQRAGSSVAQGFNNAYYQALEASRIAAIERKKRIEMREKYGNDSVNKLYNLDKSSDAIYYGTLKKYIE